MKKLLSCTLICLLNASAYADINTAFNDGKSFSSTANGSMSGLITDSSATSVLPAVNTNPKQSAYFMNGNGMVANNGSARVTECATTPQTTNQDKVECDAVNYLAGYKHKEFNLDPKTEPLVTNAKQYTSQAATASTPQVCQKQTVTTPAQYSEQSCSEHPTSSTHICHQNLIVTPTSVPVSFDLLSQSTQYAVSNSYQPTDSNHFVLNFTTAYGYTTGNVYADAYANYTFNISNPSQLVAFNLVGYMFDPTKLMAFNRVGYPVLYYNLPAAYLPKLIINGQVVYTFPNPPNVAGNLPPTSYTAMPPIDLRPYLVAGNNTIQQTLPTFLARTAIARGDYASSLQFYIDKNTYTETTSWSDDCGQLANTCNLTNKVCSAYASDPINGGQRCSQYESTYTCNDGLKGDCQVLRDQGCEQIGNSCFNTNPDGSCALYDNTFRCQTTPALTKDTFVCVDQQFCDGGLCFNDADKPNDGFTTAVAMMEAAREAGMYPGGTNGTIELFKGEQQQCTKKVIGDHTILSCCQTVAHPPITNSVTTPTYTTAQSPTPDKSTVNTTQGSAYQYDDVYNDDIMIQQLQSVLTGGWLQCSDAEKKLGIVRGQNLCVQSNDRCTSKTAFGICTERTSYFCCFKSLLAKAFNRGGRTQLGLPLTSCGGFSIDQLKQIDFSKIDLTEFMASIVPPTVDVDGTANTVKQKVNSTSGYYE